MVIVLPPHGPAPLEDGCEGSLPRPAPPPLVAFHATNDSVDSPPTEMLEVEVPEGKVERGLTAGGQCVHRWDFAKPKECLLADWGRWHMVAKPQPGGGADGSA